MHVCRRTVGAHQEGIAVRSGFRQRGLGHCAATTRLILNQDGLPHRRLKFRLDRARNNIHQSARGEAHDQVQRLGGIALGVCGGRYREPKYYSQKQLFQ